MTPIKSSFANKTSDSAIRLLTGSIPLAGQLVDVMRLRDPYKVRWLGG